MQKYQVEKIVGQGSFGKAYLVRRKTDSKRCIIKQISIGKMGAREVKQTELEATLLQRLHHPNIVKFLESFKENRSLMICMEYADGGDLEAYLKNRRGRLLREDEVLHMFVQLGLAMKHVHDRKILHRDLKSQNVFLVSNGNKPIVKLGDFGVSRVMERTLDLASTMVGTPYYMPPEICGNQRYNSKCDVWSLGVILYELMNLRYPFDGSSIKQLYANITNRAYPPVNSAQYSRPLRETLGRMLEKRANKRPSVNSILSYPIVAGHIDAYLNAKQKECEFAHTILHNQHILRGPAPKATLPLPPQEQTLRNGPGVVPGSVLSEAANRPPMPPPQTPPRGRGEVFNPPSVPTQNGAVAGGPRVAVIGNNPKVAAYYERVRREREQQQNDAAHRLKKANEQRAELAARQAAADEARKQAQARLQAQGNARARREAEALEVAAQARARLNAQKGARERERLARMDKERAEAEALAARRAKDREAERRAILRRKAEREAFEKKQEQARRLVRAKEDAREKDIAAAANAIRQVKIDKHHAAIQERNERAAARQAAEAKARREDALKARRIEASLAGVERRAEEAHIAAKKADVAWPSAEAVVLSPPTPGRALQGNAILRDKERQARLKSDEDALKERRRANLARFEADVMQRNREKINKQLEKEKITKTKAAALHQQKELALMVKGLPINVSAALRDNAKVGNFPADALPTPIKDPVNIREGEAFSSPSSDEDEMQRIKNVYADKNEESGDDSDFGNEAADDDSLVEEVDDSNDEDSKTRQEKLSDLQLDIESDDDSTDESSPNVDKTKHPLSPQASPAWLNNLKKQMGQIHSDVAVLKALSPRSGPSSNVSTPRTDEATPRAYHGGRTPLSAPSKANARTPLAMRALGGNQGPRANVQSYLQGQGTPLSRPTPANASNASSNMPVCAVKQNPEDRAVAALERRAIAQKRQDDLKQFMKQQREERIRERASVDAGSNDDEKDVEKPPKSPRKAAGGESASTQKTLHISKPTPAIVLQNRNPSGRDYSPVKMGGSRPKSGGVVVHVPAHEFNYLSTEAPFSDMEAQCVAVGSPTARKPSLSSRKPKGGDILVIEDAPGSLSRGARPSDSIATAARSRPKSTKEGLNKSVEALNPRTGHSNFKQQQPLEQNKQSLGTGHRVSLKPAVPSRVVAPRESVPSKVSPSNSVQSNVSNANLTLEERRLKREKERADMRQAMRARKDAHDAKSDIVFDLLLPLGESPYHNSGEEINPIQHKHLVDVNHVPANYVNGPFEDVQEHVIMNLTPNTNITANGMQVPESQLRRNRVAVDSDDDTDCDSPRVPGVDEEDAPPIYSEEDPAVTVAQMGGMNLKQQIASVISLGHGASVLDPDATEQDLSILLQQMQDVVGRFHARVENINTTANKEPERTDKEAATLKGSKNIAKALATMRKLEGTLQIGGNLLGTLGGDINPSAGTTITYDGSEAEVDADAEPSDATSDSDSDDDVFGEDEEDRLNFSHGSDSDDDSADFSVEEEDCSKDLGDYRPSLENSLDGTFDNVIPLDELLGGSNGSDLLQSMSSENMNKSGSLGPTQSDYENNHAVDAIADKLAVLQSHVNGSDDAEYQEKLFSSDLEDDEDSSLDSTGSIGQSSSLIDPLTMTGKFTGNLDILDKDIASETPTKTPYKSRTSFGSAQKLPKNNNSNLDPDAVGAVGGNIDVLYNRFGGDKVIKALGILRKSLESENYVTDGEELTAVQEEAARKHEDKLLSQLEHCLGEDGLQYLDNLFLLCQSMGN
jgi:serine/threonine protein kinase